MNLEAAHHIVTSKVPPQNLEAERAVLGAALLDAETFGMVADRLSADHFVLSRHRVIYRRILQLHRAGRTVDLLTVKHVLAEADELNDIGGPVTLAGLIDEASTSINVSAYVAILQDCEVKRRLIALGTKLVAGAYNGAVPADLVATAATEIDRMTAHATAPAVVDVRPIAASLARRAVELMVDYLVAPYLPARGLTAVSAMPGAGKSKLVQGLMMARALGLPILGRHSAPGPCLFWSGEQGLDEDDRVWGGFARGFGVTASEEAFRAPLLTVSDPRRSLLDPAVRDLLLDHACRHPGLLIGFDSLRRVVPGDELSSELPDLFFREVYLPLRGAGATVVLLCHPPKPPAQGDLRVESLIRGSGDWLAILDSFIALKSAGRKVIKPGTEEIYATLTHVKARRGAKGEGGTLTIRVEHDGTPEVSFTLCLDADGAGVVTKAQLATEQLAGFFRERGTATREEYLKAFNSRFSKRQLDPARKVLVAQGLLRLLNPSENQRARSWRWAEESNPRLDSALFTPDVHGGVHDNDEDA